MLNIKLFGWTFILYVIGIIFFIIETYKGKKIIILLRRIFITSGFALHFIAWCVRWYETGSFSRPPFVNTYETLVFFSWLILLFSFFIEYYYKQKLMNLFSTALALIAFGAASILPESSKDIPPLMPALQSYWLHIHILSCFIGYSGFALSAVSSILMLIKYENKDLRQKFQSIEYKSIAYGFPFLTFGIISGSIWANYAWGTYWGWDPKETWSLITWFIYAIYLHLRILKGWRGKKTAWISIIGFFAVIFTYFGVNYLLSGLHSYMS